MKKQLHPGARWLFRLEGFLLIFLFTFILTFFSKMISNSMRGYAEQPFNPFNIVGYILLIIIFAVILTEVYARMAYNRWFYEFGDDHLKIERGIIWKKYSNIPYERVQNVDVTRGIIARLCGFSTLNIQTAGFSYSPQQKAYSEGYIPAVQMEESEKIREFLMKKISKKGRKQGL